MTLSLYCVFIAALLPYMCVAYAKGTRAYIQGGNRAPREYGEALKGARKRAYWAQQNGFEAFPIFAAIVIIAHLVEKAGTMIDGLAAAFVLCRITYSIFYVVNLPTLRSLAWTGGALAEVLMVAWIAM